MTEIIKGSCCCGAVQFEVHGAPSMMGTCHCSRCRKLGASHIVFIKKDQLHWIAGRDMVQDYKPTPPYQYTRCFCKICGTALGEITSDGESFPIAANTLDDDPIVRNRFHEFVSEKPAWYGICDEVQQFDGHPTQG